MLYLLEHQMQRMEQGGLMEEHVERDTYRELLPNTRHEEGI